MSDFDHIIEGLECFVGHRVQVHFGGVPALFVPADPDYADVEDTTVTYQFNGAGIMVMKAEG